MIPWTHIQWFTSAFPVSSLPRSLVLLLHIRHTWTQTQKDFHTRTHTNTHAHTHQHHLTGLQTSPPASAARFSFWLSLSARDNQTPPIASFQAVPPDSPHPVLPILLAVSLCVRFAPSQWVHMPRKRSLGSQQAKNESEYVCVCFRERKSEGERLTCRI